MSIDLRSASCAMRPSHKPGSSYRLGQTAPDVSFDLKRAVLHEISAVPGDSAAATGFCTALALSTTEPADPIVWVQDAGARVEAGSLYGFGLSGLGLDPGRVTFISPRNVTDALRIGVEAARSPAVGAVIIETMDKGQLIDLTATRRLTLGSEKSHVTVFLLRVAGVAGPSAAWTRWRVGPAASRAPPGIRGPDTETLNAEIRAGPRFDIALLRHRGGMSAARWQVEWDCEQRAFAQTLHRPLVSLSVGGCLAA